MPKVGLTGNIGSGKSTVLKLLKLKGAEVFDCDREVHRIYSCPDNFVCKKIKEVFPGVGKEGRISREKLAAKAFSSRDDLNKLERIIHPVIIKNLKNWLKNKGREKISVVEVPLLFEKKLEGLFDKIIWVETEDETIFERFKKMGVGKERAKQRMFLCIRAEEKKTKCDFIIKNDSDLNKLKKEVNSLWQQINKI